MLYEVWEVTLELAPWLLLGAAIAGAMHAWLPHGLVERGLSGEGGVARAVAIGVPMPLCSCGVIPVGLGLKRQGAGDGPAVGFLISTPQTGVDSILVTASMLGWPFALFKVAVALATGLIGGWITKAVTPAPAPTLPVIDNAPEPSTMERVRDAFAHGDELLRSIWRWLVFGVLVSAALSAWLPEDAFGRLAAYGPLAAMGVALGVSLPLYVCATASVPIAAALVQAGLPLGAVLVFLMAGPATNAATIGAVYRGLGPRPLAVYLATIVVGSVLGGLAFEAIADTSRLQLAADQGGHDHGAAHPWWAVACGLVLVGLLVRYAIEDFKRPSDAEESHEDCCSNKGQ